jgi:enolase
MDHIASLHALEILDSRGTPTLEVILKTKKGLTASAKIPSGASKGEKEACELRDEDQKRYLGKGVLKAVANVNGSLNHLLKGCRLEQKKIDEMMIKADGTENKTNFGANAILGVSLAAARALALSAKEPLFRHLRKQKKYLLPQPMMNIINGGVHADSSLEIQEFMICPIASSFKEKLRIGVEVFWGRKAI